MAPAGAVVKAKDRKHCAYCPSPSLLIIEQRPSEMILRTFIRVFVWLGVEI